MCLSYTVQGMQAVPVPSSSGVSGRMQRQRRQDTEPELALRRALHREGLRYRVCMPVEGLRRRTIDIAFTRLRLAVFVDGCFWHGCPIHATWPKANASWWEQKILKNRARDIETTERLKADGWTVVRIWEHEPTEQAAKMIISVLEALGSGMMPLQIPDAAAETQ
jgi:DNA mismatch endonuclease, patch repair protein